MRFQGEDTDGPTYPAGRKSLADLGGTAGGGGGGGFGEVEEGVGGGPGGESEAGGGGAGERAFEHDEDGGVNGLVALGGRLSVAKDHIGPVAGDEDFGAGEVLESAVK